MSILVFVSPCGQSARVVGEFHTTTLEGLPQARRWVAFYERMVDRYGDVYAEKLAAFRRAEEEMSAFHKGDAT